jgi:hypothetical protein
MQKLNPWAKAKAALVEKTTKERAAKKAAALKAKRSKAGRKDKAKRSATYFKLQGDLKDSFKAAQDILDEEERQGNYMPGDTDEEEDDE